MRCQIKATCRTGRPCNNTAILLNQHNNWVCEECAKEGDVIQELMNQLALAHDMPEYIRPLVTREARRN